MLCIEAWVNATIWRLHIDMSMTTDFIGLQMRARMRWWWSPKCTNCNVPYAVILGDLTGLGPSLCISWGLFHPTSHGCHSTWNVHMTVYGKFGWMLLQGRYGESFPSSTWGGRCRMIRAISSTYLWWFMPALLVRYNANFALRGEHFVRDLVTEFLFACCGQKSAV